MNYAVVFTYSFDNDAAVYLFDSAERAVEFLRSSYTEELRIDTEENEWDTEASIQDDGMYAKIINHFEDMDDVTEFHIAHVYQ